MTNSHIHTENVGIDKCIKWKVKPQSLYSKIPLKSIVLVLCNVFMFFILLLTLVYAYLIEKYLKAICNVEIIYLELCLSS